jgi:hypothetical protein
MEIWKVCVQFHKLPSKLIMLLCALMLLSLSDVECSYSLHVNAHQIKTSVGIPSKTQTQLLLKNLNETIFSQISPLKMLIWNVNFSQIERTNFQIHAWTNEICFMLLICYRESFLRSKQASQLLQLISMGNVLWESQKQENWSYRGWVFEVKHKKSFWAFHLSLPWFGNLFTTIHAFNLPLHNDAYKSWISIHQTVKSSRIHRINLLKFHSMRKIAVELNFHLIFFIYS